MPITRVRNRDDLLLLAAELAPQRSIKRAVKQSRVEYLGAFDPVRPHTHPGWILRVRSEHGRTWFLAVMVDAGNRRHWAETVPEIFWADRVDGGAD